MSKFERTTEGKLGITLTGKVIIDDETYDVIYDIVRQQVLEEIIHNGYREDEMIKILSSLSVHDFIKVIENSIDEMDDIAFPKGLSLDDRRAWKIFIGLKNLLEIIDL